MEGSVLFFDRKKGFGFAAPRDRGGDVYIHHSQLPQNHRYLNEDDRVIFDVGPIVKNHRVALPSSNYQRSSAVKRRWPVSATTQTAQNGDAVQQTRNEALLEYRFDPAKLADLPQRFKDQPNWVPWRLEDHGKPKLDKVPYDAKTEKRAMPDDPETWSDFTTASDIADVLSGNDYNGIGFEFSNSPFAGIDLDECRNIKTGEIDLWAKEAIAELNSYTEVSPSRTGVHIVVEGNLPPDDTRDGQGRRAGHVEMYEGSRFLTVTGEHVAGTPTTINKRDLTAFYKKYILDRTSTGNQSKPKDNSLSAKEWAAACNIWRRLGENATEEDVTLEFFSIVKNRAKWEKNRNYVSRTICKAKTHVFPPSAKTSVTRAELSHGETPRRESASSIVRPSLSEVAYYGVVGDIVRKLEPQTESHPAGLMVELMLAWGNAIGRGPYYQVEDTRHFTNEFMVKVGESSRSRKGTGKNRIRKIMHEVDSEWLDLRNLSGFGSGEAIIHAIRDAQEQWLFDEKAATTSCKTTDPGVRDKRLCVSVGEFQGILSVCHRPDNLLSSIMRDGWDGLPLHNLVKKNPASCKQGLVSILADTTRADLSVSLSQVDRNNGFANRFLWVYVYRTKLLPEGGEPIDWTTEAGQLREALEFARGAKRVCMDKTARDRWCRTVYPKLEREIPGLVGSLTSRAAAHTIRLALLYALLDKSEHIRLEHLEAAEALWQYCEDSVQTIFGDLLSPEQAKLVDFLSGGQATKKQIIHECFHGHRKADLIQADLKFLISTGQVAMIDTDVPQYCAVGRK